MKSFWAHLYLKYIRFGSCLYFYFFPAQLGTGCVFLFLFSFKIRDNTFLTTVSGTITTLPQCSFYYLKWSECLRHIYRFLDPSPTLLGLLLKMYAGTTEYRYLPLFCLYHLVALQTSIFGLFRSVKDTG